MVMSLIGLSAISHFFFFPFTWQFPLPPLCLVEALVSCSEMLCCRGTLIFAYFHFHNTSFFSSWHQIKFFLFSAVGEVQTSCLAHLVSEWGLPPLADRRYYSLSYAADILLPLCLSLNALLSLSKLDFWWLSINYIFCRNLKLSKSAPRESRLRSNFYIIYQATLQSMLPCLFLIKDG